MYGAETLPAITTGTDLVTASSKMMTVKDAEMDEGKPKGVLAGSLGGLAKQMTLLIQTNLLQNEILFSIKDAILGLGPTDQEKKEGSIGAGDTDKPPKEKGPGILSKVGSTLGKLNPFGGGGFMDTLLKLGLAVGGLALLNIFGDKLTGPLAGLIKAFKEGKIGEKIGEIVTDIQEYLTPLWDKIKIKVGEFIAGVQTVFGIIQAAYGSIKEYIMKYDTGGAGPGGQYGDGKLDAMELKIMMGDIIKDITEAIIKFTKTIGMTILKGIGIYSFGSTALTFLIKRAALGVGLTAVGGLIGVAAIAILLAAGIYKLANHIMTAYDDAVTDELGRPQKFDTTQFFARLLAGKDHGNTMANVINNAFDKMIIFAAGGALVGSAFPVIGTGIGALIGGLSGIVIGGLSAAMGAKALDDLTTDMFGEDSPTYKMFKFLYEAYELVLLKPFKVLMGWLGKSMDFGAQTIEFIEKLPARLGYQLLDGSPLSKEDMYGENVNPKKLAVKSKAELLELQTQNQKNIEELPSQGTSIFGNPIYDTPNLNKFKQFKAIDKALFKEIEKRELDPMGSGTEYDQFMLDKIEKFKEPKFGPSKIEFGSSRQGGITYANNISDNSIKKQENQNLFGNGMSQDNPQFAAILAHNQSKLQTG